MTAPGYLSNAELKRLQSAYPELRHAGCPTCKDAGHFRWQGKDQECLCTEQKRLHVRYLHAGIGLTYQRLSWGDVGFDVAAACPKLADYLDNFDYYLANGMGLFIPGPVGSGKTLLLMLILKELVKRDYDCYTTTFANTVESFTATWGDNEEKRWFAKKFMGSQVLGLDDLGKEFRSSNRLAPTTFDNILRTRVQNARPTILTTNMTAQEVGHGYGSAALSMLVERSLEMPLTGADFRPIAHGRSLAEIENKETRPIV